MVRLIYKVSLVDLVLLVALYDVLQDLAWRANYASTPHAAVSGYDASSTYSLLVRFFTMAGSGVSLTSPPTLDWVQALVVVFIAANGWLFYQLYRSRVGRPTAAGLQAPER